MQLDWPEEIFAYLWVLCSLVFAPWFFLAGIPDNFDQLEEDKSYPKLLDIFTKFILLPLTGIFLFILYAYGARVLLTGQWPQGQVVYIITSILVPSLLTAILLFPKGHFNWAKRAIKAIFVLILPLMVLYFAAIWFRLQDYGFTESRYLVIVFGLWEFVFITSSPKSSC